MQLNLLVNMVILLEVKPGFHYSVLNFVKTLIFWLERSQALEPFN